MSLLRRLTKLEAATGQLTTEGTPDADRLRLVALLEAFPTDWLEDVRGDRVVELRATCKTVASRVRDGDFRTYREMMHELPTEALRGIAAQREHAG